MKKIISSIISLLLVLSLTPINTTFAEEQRAFNDYFSNFTDSSIKLLKSETGLYSQNVGQQVTYIVDENNNIVKVEGTGTITTRGVGLAIAVYVGRFIVGYVLTTVVEGIVIAVTGESSAWWFSQAVTQLLKQRYTESTTINCDVYPPHSYEGAKCRAV